MPAADEARLVELERRAAARLPLFDDDDEPAGPLAAGLPALLKAIRPCPGVHYCRAKGVGRWRVYVRGRARPKAPGVRRKRVHVGWFKTLPEAVRAWAEHTGRAAG